MTAHHVYRCFGHDGRLMYVGCTGNLPMRLYAHSLNSFWAYDVAKVKAVVFPTREEARSAETLAIQQERPRFNIKHRWASHMTWDVEEFDDYLQALAALPHTGYSDRRIERVRAIRARVVARQAAA